ncbi:MAG: reprolysin-like metallopeptidase [Actinomycetota bacterium]
MAAPRGLRPARRARVVLSAALLVSSGLAAALGPPTPAEAATAPPLPAFTGAPGWSDVGPVVNAAARSRRTPDIRVRAGRRVSLTPDPLRGVLARAPREGAPDRHPPVVLGLPTPTGGVARFAVSESPVVAPALGRRHPETRSYAGTGIDNPAASVRLDLGPLGFHAQVLSPAGNWYIDPETRDDATAHVAYRRADLLADADPWRELEPLPAGGKPAPAARAASAPLARTIGPVLRTYRLALATTGEYAQFHGGTVALVHNELVTAVNRVNGIYRRDLGIRLQLVAGNDSLIRLDPNTDGYTNDDANLLLVENQTRIDGVIGDAGYDIGHVFSTGGGGLAFPGVVSLTGHKAKGETGRAVPTGDAFWVEYVAHELGHQFGAMHTFSGTTGACAGNGDGPSAMEPGSGSTIMGYAGICGVDNLQKRTAPNSSSDPFFHALSFEQIQAVVTSPGRGGTTSVTGNATPAVTPTGGAAWTVPPRTPFVLSATATDANLTDAVSLQWEQYDGGVLHPLTATPKNAGALFRSFPPTSGRSGSRTFPKMASVIANTTNAATGSCPALPGGLACWSEFLPTSARTMNFRVTARDNRAAGGGVANADTTVTVAGATPFRVTSQSTPTFLTGNRSITVTWEVAGTNAAPFNVPTVDIRLTADGGTTFTMLAAATPNDGSQTVVLPRISTINARIQVRAVGSVFFDLNDANLSIQSSPIATGGAHACALATGGTVKCWGDNYYGALGNSVVGISDVPVPVTGLTGAVGLLAGGGYSCALLATGTVKCWGNNDVGQLGNGTTTNSSIPVTVLATTSPPTPLTGVIAIDANGRFACALLATGTMKCWGNNEFGQLGNGTTTNSSIPVTVLATTSPPTPLTGVINIGMGGWHGCAVLTGGTVKCWGFNPAGQLGNGTLVSSSVPVPVSGLTGAAEVSAGANATCALLTSGTAKCWGGNEWGVYGNGTVFHDSLVPVPGATGLTGIADLEVGQYNACALLRNGTARCWGFNGTGQLGNGTTCRPYATPDNCDSWVPVTVSGLSGGVSVSIGYVFACVLLGNGGGRCWGMNTEGQLGDGHGGHDANGIGYWSNVPVPVVGLP